MKVKIVKLTDFTKEEWDLNEENYQKLIAHNNKIAVVCSVIFDGYCTVEFEDGFCIEALSTYHVEETLNIKDINN